jgi:hypothetical protein
MLPASNPCLTSEKSIFTELLKIGAKSCRNRCNIGFCSDGFPGIDNFFIICRFISRLKVLARPIVFANARPQKEYV